MSGFLFKAYFMNIINSATKFLKILLDDNYITKETSLSAISTLEMIKDSIPNIPMPRIGPGPDGMVGLTWESCKYHINIEIMEKSPYVEVYIENIGSDIYTEEHDYIRLKAIILIKQIMEKYT
jgi:hypothetical protein